MTPGALEKNHLLPQSPSICRHIYTPGRGPRPLFLQPRSLRLFLSSACHTFSLVLPRVVHSPIRRCLSPLMGNKSHEFGGGRGRMLKRLDQKGTPSPRHSKRPTRCQHSCNWRRRLNDWPRREESVLFQSLAEFWVNCLAFRKASTKTRTSTQMSTVELSKPRNPKDFVVCKQVL